MTQTPDGTPARPGRSPEELEAEIAEARQRLAATLDELKVQVQPGSLARRGRRAMLGWFTDEYGGVRPERVAIVVGVTVTVVAFKVWRRSRRCHCH